MKKFAIGTLFIGLASLGFSQSATSEMGEVKLSDVTITSLNADYLDKVEGSLSPWVLTLEQKASRFNIKESPFYNPGGLSKIRFIQRKGKIFATYDRNGKILSTQEWYNNLVLPQAVRNAVYLAYPEWNMEKNSYRVSYNRKKGAKKIYKIQIQKDGLKKNLKFDADGNEI